jgi:hypothetical protein
MSDVNRQIRDRIEAFVAELDGLVRESLVETIRGAFGREGNGRRRGRGRPAVARGRRGKRTSDQIVATSKVILTQVRRQPGQGVEHIARVLKTSTKDLMLPIKKLLAEKQIRTTGVKRATKYFPK